MDTCEGFIKDHHKGYTGWTEHERNQAQLARNTYGRAGDTKSARGGRALLCGLIQGLHGALRRIDAPRQRHPRLSIG